MADERIDGHLAALGKLLGMVVHDLRNPGATIGANVSFLQESLRGRLDEDAGEALQDVERALADLMMGLEHVSWIGRSLSGEPPIASDDGLVSEAIRKLRPPPPGQELKISLPSDPLRARGGGRALHKIVQLLVENAAQHARRGVVEIRARADGNTIVVEVADEGVPLGDGFRDSAFTLEGQLDIKGKSEGRYGRVAGLYAAQLLCSAIGATIEADSEHGTSIFRVRLQAA